MYYFLSLYPWSAGNEYFRQLVAANVRNYLTANTRVDKNCIVQSIVVEIKNASPNGGFVRKDPRSGEWFVVDDATAREKVGATFRSMIRKAGGEESFLSQLKQLDQNDQYEESPSSGTEPLSEWIPPAVLAQTLQEMSSEASIYQVPKRKDDEMPTVGKWWSELPAGPKAENWATGVSDNGPE